MRPSDEYDIVTRRAGGVQIIPSMCEDGFVHVFRHMGGTDLPVDGPVCGTDVMIGRPPEDDDAMCISCATAAESWAQGGALVGGQA